MDESVARVRSLMTEQGLAVLCTVQPDGQPYTSLVAGFATLRANRKFDNLLFEPRVDLLLDDRANQASDVRQAATVTVLGRARMLEGTERERWVRALLSRHAALGDLLRSPDCAMVVVDVDRLLLVTRLQHVVKLAVTGGVVERVPSGVS